MTPLWVPAASPLVFTASVMAPELVPLAGVSVSQPASSLADQFKVPPPLLLTLSVWLFGFAPPACAVKVNVLGLRAMDGGGVTVSVTLAVLGVLLAPTAATVM